MASKRSSNESPSTTGAPPVKRLVIEPIKIGPVATQEEMDKKILQFQNKKLAERIQERKKAEDELKKRIDQLEQRQTTDDAVLCIVNRYWNQLDDDVRVLLQRFDAEVVDVSEQKDESPAVTSFLNLLSQWDQEEIEEKLRQRVEFSKRAIGKLLTAIDRLMQRNRRLEDSLRVEYVKLSKEEGQEDLNLVDGEKNIKKEQPKCTGDAEVPIVKNEAPEVTDDDLDPDRVVPQELTEAENEPKPDSAGDKEDMSDTNNEETENAATSDNGVAVDKASKLEVKKELEPLREVIKAEVRLERITAAVWDEMLEFQKESKRLNDLNTELLQKFHSAKLRESLLNDKLAAFETENAEVKNTKDDLQYDLENALAKVDKFDRLLAEMAQKLKTYEEGPVTTEKGEQGVSKNKFQEIAVEVEEQRELAASRLTELEEISKEHQEALKQVEQLKLDLANLPEHVIVESTEYKCLQSKFSVLYNESVSMKNQLEESRTLLSSCKAAQQQQVHHLETEELACQNKLRQEVIKLNDQLGQVRKDYEFLRLELEQTLAANDQTGPINREMRNLISSLKNQNEQLKGELMRYKRKYNESENELLKVKMELETCHAEEEKVKAKAAAALVGEETPAEPQLPRSPVAHSQPVEMEPESPPPLQVSPVKSDSVKKTDGEIVKDLRLRLKTADECANDMKLLLDTYKSVSKEARDKVQLMAAEKKARLENEELRQSLRLYEENDRKDRRRLAEDEALRKIQKLEEHNIDLSRNLKVQKQEEEALLSEMEVTGQAYEEMQEQNTRLLQQLREKDDANFKLMSERIKWGQIQKLLREEKEHLNEQISALRAQIEAQNVVVRKLEEQERLLHSNLQSCEKQLSIQTHASDAFKRKSLETSQTAADLQLHLDKYHSQLKEAEQGLYDKTAAVKQEAFKYKRAQEEMVLLKRKLERMQKFETATSTDQVLMEEIREYKEQLTCPSCKVKKKDAVLTKCFHVFCLHCLRTRYESRQRKCPKCNATFGINDYHRLFLE